MADGITFDARNLEELGRDLRHAVGEVRRETQVELGAIGIGIAAAAKEIASQHSQTIPSTIKTRPIPGAVVITAGDQSTPIAALDELGNKGAKRSAATFRHPVFGNKNVWVEQDKHPFLAPALLSLRKDITRRLERAWERALHSARIRME